MVTESNGLFQQTLNRWQPLWFLISAVGTILLAFVAVFQDRLRTWISSPRLDLDQGPFLPDFKPVPIGNIGEACYLQIRIKNNRTTAEKVEVFIAKIEKEINGIPHEIESFYPLNLKWRHYDTVFLDRLSPRTRRDCTLGRITNPNNREIVRDNHPSLNLPPDVSPFRLELAVIPSTRSDLLAPGIYRLHLEIGASNAKPKKKIIRLKFNGRWSHNTKDMAEATTI